MFSFFGLASPSPAFAIPCGFSGRDFVRDFTSLQAGSSCVADRGAKENLTNNSAKVSSFGSESAPDRLLQFEFYEATKAPPK